MIGRGVSYGALSVINAIAMGKGAGFGIDLKTEDRPSHGRTGDCCRDRRSSVRGHTACPLLC